MQRVVALVVLGLALLTVCVSCASFGPRSVVNYDPVPHGAQEAGYSGSGFIWNGRYIITSSHSCHNDVVDVVLGRDLFLSIRCKARVAYRYNDIALIDLGKRESAQGLRLAFRDPYPGQRLWILDGSRSSRPALQAMAISPDSLRILDGEKSIRHGSSGSPVVDEKGDVVGMVFASLRLGGKELVSIHPVSEIRDLVDGHLGLIVRGQ